MTPKAASGGRKIQSSLLNSKIYIINFFRHTNVTNISTIENLNGMTLQPTQLPSFIHFIVTLSDFPSSKGCFDYGLPLIGCSVIWSIDFEVLNILGSVQVLLTYDIQHLEGIELCKQAMTLKIPFSLNFFNTQVKSSSQFPNKSV